MRRLVLALPLVVLACAAIGDPRPQEARLSSNGDLRVMLTDGQVCRATRAEAVAQGPRSWAGQMSGCTVPLSYSVTLDDRRSHLAQIVGAIFAALTLDPLLAPAGTVSVQDEVGRNYVFQSPPPQPVH